MAAGKSTGTTKTETIKLDEATGDLEGTVKAQDTGKVPADARVTVFDGTTEIDDDVVGSDGSYAFSDLPVGTYTVVATGTNYDDASKSVTIRGDATTTQDFTLERTVAKDLTITVTEAFTGTKLQGASVKLVLQSDSTVTAGPYTTGSDGTYVFKGLGEGTYVLTASKSGYRTATKNVHASPDKENAESIALTKLGTKGTIIVKVEGRASKSDSWTALSGATVYVYKPNGTTLWESGSTGTTDSSGTWKKELEAGKVDVRATKSGYEDLTTEDYWITANQDNTITIRIEKR